MRRFFVDAFYWIALLNPRDQWHARVLAFDTTLDAYHFYTTDEVQYSLTDCRFMQVMRHEGLTDVLTNDHHFAQEGLHIVFP